MDEIEFWRHGEWTMVYVNGKLERSGDHYLADEWLQERFGVSVVDDDAGTCIPDGRTPLDSLAEVRQRVAERDARLVRAQDLRRQAEALEREAAQLEAPR